jgi:hypothetical protein
MELFAIIRLDTNKLVWASYTSQEVADDHAVRWAVSVGMISLLSGQELVDHLVDNMDEYAGHHGSPKNVYGDLDVTL